MQQEDSKKRLDDLPESQNDFWDTGEFRGERHTAHWQTKEEARREVKITLKEHYFVRVTGHQAQCTHCNWGFQLDRGDKIRNGHLYDKNGKLVI